MFKLQILYYHIEDEINDGYFKSQTCSKQLTNATWLHVVLLRNHESPK